VWFLAYRENWAADPGERSPHGLDRADQTTY
jgi:hypothetical protein